MNSKLDADIVIIFLLPLVLVVFLLIPNSEVSLFGSILTFAIFFYELIVFKKRRIYGFTGLRIVSIPSIVILIFTIFISIPAIFIASSKNGNIRYVYFFSITSFYLFYPIGLLIANEYKNIHLKKIKQIYRSSFSKQEAIDPFFFKALIVLFIICLITVILYFIRSNTYPLFELIKNPGSYLKLKFMREQALKLLDITFIERYLFNWLRSLFIPFGITGFLFLTVVYKKKKYTILFLSFLIFGLFVNTFTLEKSPIAAIFLVIFTLFFLKLHRITIKFVVTSLLLIFSSPFLITLFLHFGRENVLHIVYISLLNRVFIVPSETLYHYFKIFPQTHDFLLGRSTQMFSWLFDKGQFPISNYVAKIWWDLPHTSGLANTNYLGNFWADFGWFGIILSTIFVGIVIHLFYWKILVVSNYKKNIIYTTIIASCVPIFTFGFFSSNFTTLFFTRGLILVVILLFVIPKLFNQKTTHQTEKN